MDAELAGDRVDVVLHGLLRKIKLTGNAFVRHSACHPRRNLPGLSPNSASWEGPTFTMTVSQHVLLEGPAYDFGVGGMA